MSILYRIVYVHTYNIYALWKTNIGTFALNEYSADLLDKKIFSNQFLFCSVNIIIKEGFNSFTATSISDTKELLGFRGVVLKTTL